jgi:hypothetical protein
MDTLPLPAAAASRPTAIASAPVALEEVPSAVEFVPVAFAAAPTAVAPCADACDAAPTAVESGAVAEALFEVPETPPFCASTGVLMTPAWAAIPPSTLKANTPPRNAIARFRLLPFLRPLANSDATTQVCEAAFQTMR